MTIQVIAHTNSKRPRVLKDSSGLFHIYVSQPPSEGKANKAVVEALAEYFNISKARIKPLAGQKSKMKLFKIDK